jgi:hypothetical protein
MSSRLNGALAGAIGGLAGTLAMNYAQRAWTLAADGHAPASAADHHDARDWQERSEHQNANELAAQTLAETLLGRGLRQHELGPAAAAVHFTFGTAVGALYGGSLAAPGRRRRSAVAMGAGLGITLWMLADELAMPLLGLSRPTTERPREMHLQSLASHLVYGIVTEHVRALVHTTGRKRAGAGARGESTRSVFPSAAGTLL